jgi:hypothetical protein
MHLKDPTTESSVRLHGHKPAHGPLNISPGAWLRARAVGPARLDSGPEQSSAVLRTALVSRRCFEHTSSKRSQGSPCWIRLLHSLARADQGCSPARTPVARAQSVSLQKASKTRVVRSSILGQRDRAPFPGRHSCQTSWRPGSISRENISKTARAFTASHTVMEPPNPHKTYNPSATGDLRT